MYRILSFVGGVPEWGTGSLTYDQLRDTSAKMELLDSEYVIYEG